MSQNPEALGEEGEQKKRGKALWSPDVDARKAHAAVVGGSVCKLVCALSCVGCHWAVCPVQV